MSMNKNYVTDFPEAILRDQKLTSQFKMAEEIWKLL